MDEKCSDLFVWFVCTVAGNHICVHMIWLQQINEVTGFQLQRVQNLVTGRNYANQKTNTKFVVLIDSEATSEGVANSGLLGVGGIHLDHQL